MRTVTHHKLSVEKRRTTRTTVSPDEKDPPTRARKIVNGTSPPIQKPAAQRWSMSPDAPNGCARAAAAWLIQANEIRRITLINQRTSISALRALTFPTPKATRTSTNAVAIRPRRSSQTRPNCVLNKTVPHAVTDRAFLRDNSLMLATSSQNQKRADSRAVIRLQRARRNKRRST